MVVVAIFVIVVVAAAAADATATVPAALLLGGGAVVWSRVRGGTHALEHSRKHSFTSAQAFSMLSAPFGTFIFRLRGSSRQLEHVAGLTPTRKIW